MADNNQQILGNGVTHVYGWWMVNKWVLVDDTGIIWIWARWFPCLKSKNGMVTHCVDRMGEKAQTGFMSSHDPKNESFPLKRWAFWDPKWGTQRSNTRGTAVASPVNTCDHQPVELKTRILAHQCPCAMGCIRSETEFWDASTTRDATIAALLHYLTILYEGVPDVEHVEFQMSSFLFPVAPDHLEASRHDNDHQTPDPTTTVALSAGGDDNA